MYEHFFSNYMLELHKMISNGFDTNTFKVAQDQSLWKHTNKELTWFHSYSLSYTRNFTNSVKQFAKLPKRCKTKLGLKSFRLNFLIFGSRDHLVDIGHFCQSQDKTGTSFGFFICRLLRYAKIWTADQSDCSEVFGTFHTIQLQFSMRL